RSHREAIRLQPKVALAHYGLGHALGARGDREGAVKAYLKAIDLDPNHAEAHCNLGVTLRDQGQFAAAVASLRRGHDLGSRRRGWPYPSAAWLKQCQALAELDARLPTFLNGTQTATGPTQQLDLARVCAAKRLHAASAGFYASAFQADPKLAHALQ